MKSIIPVILLSLIFVMGSAQVDSCKNQITPNFIRNEKDYSFKINNKKDDPFKIEFSFYGGFIYRIVMCPENNEKLSIIVKDSNGNILYNNSYFDYANVWDFRFQSNMECTIEIKSVDEASNSINVMMYAAYKGI